MKTINLTIIFRIQVSLVFEGITFQKNLNLNNKAGISKPRILKPRITTALRAACRFKAYHVYDEDNDHATKKNGGNYDDCSRIEIRRVIWKVVIIEYLQCNYKERQKLKLRPN